MTWLESAFVAYLVLHLAMALHVSFDTKGGAEGQTPVLAHAVGLPFIAVGGAAALDLWSSDWRLPFWVYVVAYPVGVVAVGGLIELAGRLGSRGRRA